MKNKVIGVPKPKKRKRSDTKRMKDKAWSTFSLYIRLSNCVSGDYASCYTCGSTKPYKELQAGHGIPGRNNAVLFMEEVVKPQCWGCNGYGRGKYPVFTEKLIKELGMERYSELVTYANQTLDYTINDYRDIYELYSRKVEELK